MTPEIAKRIAYNRHTSDFDCYVTVEGCEEQYIGSASTYYDGEARCREYAMNHYTDNHTPEKAAQVVMAGSLPADVAAATYPAFQRFVAQVETLGLPAVVLDLGARLADDMAAALT